MAASHWFAGITIKISTLPAVRESGQDLYSCRTFHHDIAIMIKQNSINNGLYLLKLKH
jgi:hypothetical protein